MKTIALLNMKGGVGKTTLAVNLAWNLSRKGERVLLVDLDPQFNASQYLMSYDKWDKHRKKNATIADILLDAPRSRMTLKEKSDPDALFRKALAPVEMSSDKSAYLFLLPSELELARVVKNPQGVEYRLQKALDGWKKYFSFTFIDCAPTDSVLTATALTAADYVLVPMRPDRFSILGYSLIKEVLEAFRNDYPDPNKVKDLGVVFTHVSRTGDAIEEDCKKKIAKDATHVFNTEIKVSNSYLRAVHEQSPVFDTRYARELTKNCINELVTEIRQRIIDLDGEAPTASVPAPGQRVK